MTLLKPVPNTKKKALLERTVALVKEGKVVFVGTNNEYVWHAAEGDFKWSLTRSKAGMFCLSVYGTGFPAVHIRSSGGELHSLFYDLLYYARLREEEVSTAALLAELGQHFGATK